MNRFYGHNEKPATNKIELRYRTFQQLLDDVMVDFSTYSQENLIEPQQLIKIAKAVNKDLGLKIFKTKETILDIDKHRAKLPDDFYVFNTGFVCGEHTVSTILPQGTTMTEVPYPRYTEVSNHTDLCGPELCPTEKPSCGGCGTCNKCVTDIVEVPGFNPLIPYGDRCVKPRVFMNCKGEAWELIQILQTQTRHYKHFMPVRLVDSAGMFLDDCPNTRLRCENWVALKDGFIHTNMRHCKLYMCYEGNMEDDDGNLLVLDHDTINTYYEYSLKERILENLWLSGEEVERKLAFMKEKKRLARIDAWYTVRMPEFSELQEAHREHKRHYNHRYVDMFKSWSWWY